MEPAHLRQLVSGSGTYAEKLALAHSLAQQLLPHQDASQLASMWVEDNISSDSSAQQQQLQLPAVVHAHYIQAVCDWATNTLTESASAASGHSIKSSGAARKHKKQQVADTVPDNIRATETTGDPAAASHMCARLWWLAACLAQAGARHLPAGIIAAAAQACRQLVVPLTDVPSAGKPWDWQAQSQLLSGIHRLLAAATGTQHGLQHGSIDWQPSLDSLSSLLAALLQMHQASQRVHTDTKDSAQHTWQQVWSALTHLTLSEMLSSLQASQNPRKALAAVLHPVSFHSLLQIAFPEPVSHLALSTLLGNKKSHMAARRQHVRRTQPGHTHQALSGADTQLAANALQVLEAALLHETHVQGIAEACAQLMQPVLQTGTAKAVAAAKHQASAQEVQQAEHKAGQQPQQQQQAVEAGQFGAAAWDTIRSYHASIFQALRNAVSNLQPEVRSAALCSLPWLLETASKAVARLRRLQLADASNALRSALQRSNKTSTRQGGDDEYVDSTDTPLRDAEFHMFGVLCSMVLFTGPAAAGDVGSDAHVTAGSDAAAGKSKQQRKGQAPPAPLSQPSQGAAISAAAVQEQHVDLMHGLTLLIAAAKGAHAYEPTQDYTQVQRKFLTCVMQHVLKYTRNTAHTTADNTAGNSKASASMGLPSDSHTAAAVCGVMCAMLELEYRALSCSLPAVWALLMHTATRSILHPTSDQHGFKADTDLVTVNRLENSASLTSCQEGYSTTPNGGLAVAAASMQQLVRAYTELRQFQVLLDSVFEALQTAGKQEQEAASTGQHHLEAACLSRIVSDGGVQRAIHQAIRQLPPGQYAPLLMSFVTHIPRLASNGDAAQAFLPPAMLLAATQLAIGCITAIRLELPTAMPIANACSQLVAAVAPGLLKSLSRLCKKQRTKLKEDATARASQMASATLLLRVYQAAVGLHAQCAGINPEISPLPGQGTTWTSMMQPGKVTGSSADDAAAATYWLHHSFFSAAAQAVGDPAQTDLHQLIVKATAKQAARSPPQQAAQDSSDTGQAASCDPLLVLARDILHPTLDSLLQTSQPGSLSASSGKHLQQGAAAQEIRAGCTIAQTALASAINSCLIQYLQVLQEQTAYLRAACLHMDQRDNMQQMLLRIQQNSRAVSSMLLPSWFSKQGFADAAQPVSEGGKLLSCGSSLVAKGSDVLPNWIHGKAAPAGISYATASADQVLFRASGGSNSSSSSNPAAAACSLLLQQCWAASLQCLSTRTCDTSSQASEPVQATLQLMLLSAGAMLQSSSNLDREPNTAGDRNEGCQGQSLLQHMGSISHCVLQLPNWQLQAVIHTALPTTVLQATAALIQQCTAAVQALYMQDASSNDHVKQLLAAIKGLLQGDLHKAGKKASKAFKQQAQQWSDSVPEPIQGTGGHAGTPPSKKAKHMAAKAHATAQEPACQAVQQYASLLQCLGQSLQMNHLTIQDLQMLMNFSWVGIALIAELLQCHPLVPDTSTESSAGHPAAARLTGLLLDALYYSLQWCRSLQRACQVWRAHASLHTGTYAGQSVAATAVIEPLLACKRQTKWLHGLSSLLHHTYHTSEHAHQARGCVVACAAMLEGSVSLELQALRCQSSAGSSQAAAAGTDGTDTVVPGQQELQQAVQSAQQLLDESAKLLSVEARGAQTASTQPAAVSKTGRKRKSVAVERSHIESVATQGKVAVLALMGSAYLTAAVQHVDALCAGEGIPSTTAARESLAGMGSTEKAARRRKKAGACVAAACVKSISGLLVQVEWQVRQSAKQVLTAVGPWSSHIQSSCCIAYAAVARMAAATATAPEQPLSSQLVSEQGILDMLQVISKGTRTADARSDAGEQAALISCLQALTHLAVSMPVKAAAEAGHGSISAQVLNSAAGGSSQPGTAQAMSVQPSLSMQLLDAHIMLMAQCCPPSIAGMPSAQQHGTVAGLLFDLPTDSWPCTARAMLLGSVRHLLQSIGVAQFNAMLHHITDSMQQLSTPNAANTQPPPSAAAAGAGQHQLVHTHLPVQLLCMLVACEVEAGPSISQRLSRECHNIIHLLTQLLLTLATQGTIVSAVAPTVRATGASSAVPTGHAAVTAAGAADSVPGRLIAGVAGMGSTGACWTAAACVAFRILESFIGRPTTFQLNDCQVSNIMSSAGLLFQATSSSAGLPMNLMSGPLCAACSLINSCIRHRPQSARGCAPLLVDCVRAMLLCMVRWAGQHHMATGYSSAASEQTSRHVGGNSAATLATEDAAVVAITQCSVAISRVYEALVQDKEHVAAVRMYCMCLVSDYITHVAMALPPTTDSEEGGPSSHQVVQPGQGGLLPPPAATALRNGVLLLLGALGPGELQALHVALGPGWAGARRGVLAALRKEWERSVKYTGKV